MELFNTLELDNKCRTCLNPLEDMYNLFEIFDQGLSLFDIFKSTTDIEVRKDGLPTNICKKCANILVDFYNFKTVFLKNDIYLKSIFENPDEELLKLSHIEQEETYNSHSTGETLISEDEDKIRSPIDEGYTYLPENECILVVDNNMQPDSGDDLVSDQEVDNEESSTGNLKQEETYLSEGEIESKEMKGSEIFIEEEDIKNLKYLEKYTSLDTSNLPEDKCILVFSDDHVTLSESKTTSPSLKYNHSEHAKSLYKHEESVSLVCNECEVEFSAVADLQKHLKKHMPFRCVICGIRFKKKRSLIEHSKVHSSYKKLSHKPVSKKHKKSRIKPEYLCEHCGKKFNDRSTIIVHRRTVHLKHRNFHCEICNLWFPLRATLQKHTLRRHTVREKTFACSICENSYTERYSLMRHFARTHTNVHKYTCKKCKREYLTKYTLINHVRKHHSPEADLKDLSDYCDKTEITNKDCSQFEELVESD